MVALPVRFTREPPSPPSITFECCVKIVMCTCCFPDREGSVFLLCFSFVCQERGNVLESRKKLRSLSRSTRKKCFTIAFSISFFSRYMYRGILAGKGRSFPSW